MSKNTVTKRILVAEDERPLALALKIKLTKSGFMVSIAHNGQEALDMLDKDQFDIMLLDLMMPKKDGLTVLEEMKQRQLTLPVVVATNLNNEEQYRKAVSLGAKGYIVKSDTPIHMIVKKLEMTLSM